jgi:hypothetical protein
VPNGIKIKHKDTALFDINRCYNEKIGDWNTIVFS